MKRPFLSFIFQLLFFIFHLLTFIFQLSPFTYLCAAFEERMTTARILALSGTSVGIKPDVDAVFYNPAMLVKLDALKLNVSYGDLYGVLNYRIFTVATPVPFIHLLKMEIGTIGFAVEQFSFQDQYKETKLFFSHGFNITENLSIGYSIKSMRLSILYDERYTEKTLNSFDISGLIDFSENFSAGVVFSNINSPKIVDEEIVPMSYKFGIGYRPVNYFNFGLDYEKGDIWRLCVELTPERFFVFRSGINLNPLKFSFGIGLNLWKFRFDYGLSYHPQLELQSIATLSFIHRFKEKPVEETEIKEEPVEKLPVKPVEEPKPPDEEIIPEEPPTEKITPEEPPKKELTPEEPPVKKITPEEKIPIIEILPLPKININTAEMAELKTFGLPERIIKNIIRYRKYKGNFKTVDDLKKVPGVTKDIFESIKDRITVE